MSALSWVCFCTTVTYKVCTLEERLISLLGRDVDSRKLFTIQTLTCSALFFSVAVQHKLETPVGFVLFASFKSRYFLSIKGNF